MEGLEEVLYNRDCGRAVLRGTCKLRCDSKVFCFQRAIRDGSFSQSKLYSEMAMSWSLSLIHGKDGGMRIDCSPKGTYDGICRTSSMDVIVSKL